MDEVIVVCGYGCFPTPRLRGYLAEVARYIRDHSDRTAAVITSGGYTHQRSSPGVSEAGMMERQLRRLGVKAPIVREEASHMTTDNLLFSRKLVEGDLRVFPLRARVTIFCDSIREIKVRHFARRIFAGRRVRVIGYDFGRPMKEVLKQVFATPLEILAFHSAPVERWLRANRLALSARR